jgi:hypothetical protein
MRVTALCGPDRCGEAELSGMAMKVRKPRDK